MSEGEQMALLLLALASMILIYNGIDAGDLWMPALTWRKRT